jgi:hypothetical protein
MVREGTKTRSRRKIVISPSKSRYQEFVPFFDQSRSFSADQLCKCEQRFASVPYWVIERIPVFAVFSIVIRDDVLEPPSLFEFGISAGCPPFDVLQVLKDIFLALCSSQQFPPHYIGQEIR